MASAEKRSGSTDADESSVTRDEKRTTTTNGSEDGAPSSSKKPKLDDLPVEEELKNPCRRVIAILPGAGNGTLNNDIESSDNELSDTRSEGVLETSTDSSDYDSGIPFPTKTKVVHKKSEHSQSAH